jgi:hypothetical protein
MKRFPTAPRTFWEDGKICMWPDAPLDYVNHSAIALNYQMARLKILLKVQNTIRMIWIQGRKAGTHDALPSHHSADSLI